MSIDLVGSLDAINRSDASSQTEGEDSVVLLRRAALVSVSKLLESAESFGFKGCGLIRPGAVDVDA